MAKILYEVKQNKNSFSVAFGKWYAQIKNLETLNTRKLAQHISEHGSIYTPDVVYGVLEKFRSCLIEMLLNSKKVKIEGLLHPREPEERCAEEGGLQREQAPEGATHPIPARADYRGEHLQPSVPEAGRVYQHRFTPEQGGGGD